MKKNICGIVSHKGYDYKYSIKLLRIEDGEEVVQFICKGAKINQEFLKSDIKGLIIDLPNIIDKVTEENKIYFIKIRVSKNEKIKLENNAKKNKLDISKYIKAKCI